MTEIFEEINPDDLPAKRHKKDIPIFVRDLAGTPNTNSKFIGVIKREGFFEELIKDIEKFFYLKMDTLWRCFPRL